MSASTPDSVSIADYDADLNYNYTAFASFTVVCYELIITFQHEYEFVWKRKWSAATWLFLANRYLVLAVMIAEVVPSSPRVSTSTIIRTVSKQCHPYCHQTCSNPSLQIFASALLELPVVPVAGTFSYASHAWQIIEHSSAFSALRVFALLDHAYIVFAFVLILGVAPFGLDLYYFTVRYASLAMALCTITADIIAIAITWIKTYRHVREASSVGIRVGFGATLLQYGTSPAFLDECRLISIPSEGTLYFIILCISNLAQGLSLFPLFEAIEPANVLLNIFPNIVLSRFLINLRQVDSAPSSSVVRSSQFSTPNFRVPSIPNIIGNLGEPLVHHEENVENEERFNTELGDWEA
ncbi:hypothetical protein NM688_g3610 [Phlebia brevispora]|uniref:Uncharacterized protein n=1 Tax=Phlebia brevispora TaxID=194682 RepID=A0ACC1T5H2_9APHY|nr:hypothetical protein NM688_g3610 [Phlebia brevispora]